MVDSTTFSSPEPSSERSGVEDLDAATVELCSESRDRFLGFCVEQPEVEGVLSLSTMTSSVLFCLVTVLLIHGVKRHVFPRKACVVRTKSENRHKKKMRAYRGKGREVTAVGFLSYLGSEHDGS